jgi:hypothetical protein
MSSNKDWEEYDDGTDGTMDTDAQDVVIEDALNNFKLSVHAWSDAAYNRPRPAVQTLRYRSWRLAAGWALGCALVAGSVSGGVIEHRHQLDLARQAAAQKAAQQEQLLKEQEARQVDEEDLLAKVDSDVSRQVPSAMEPLAQMMSDEDSK